MINQPKFSGSEAAIITGNLIRQMRDQKKQERLAEQKEIQTRQQVIQELYAAGCLNSFAYLNPLVQDAFQLSSKSTQALPAKAAVHFGMALGQSVWNSTSGKTNEQGLSTTVSNSDPSESWKDVGRTQREKEYLKVKEDWKAAKVDPEISEAERERLKAKKHELKPGAKASKQKAAWVEKGLSLGASNIPGPIGAVSGLVTKPVAAKLVNMTENNNSSGKRTAKDNGECIVQ